MLLDSQFKTGTSLHILVYKYQTEKRKQKEKVAGYSGLGLMALTPRCAPAPNANVSMQYTDFSEHKLVYHI